MQPKEILIFKNIEFLRQGRELIARLDDGLYCASVPPLSQSGVGVHFRHCLDYYRCFLAGLPSRRIDYDARLRDPQLETDRRIGMERIDQLSQQLHSAAELDADLRLLISVDNPAGEHRDLLWSPSTLMRELQSLISHTVHHYALIAMLLRSRGCEPDPEFGVAPSTLEHWREVATCSG